MHSRREYICRQTSKFYIKLYNYLHVSNIEWYLAEINGLRRKDCLLIKIINITYQTQKIKFLSILFCQIKLCGEYCWILYLTVRISFWSISPCFVREQILNNYVPWFLCLSYSYRYLFIHCCQDKWKVNTELLANHIKIDNSSHCCC